MEGKSVIKGSKEVLIKAVVDQAILTYVMGCFISLLWWICSYIVWWSLTWNEDSVKINYIRGE